MKNLCIVSWFQITFQSINATFGEPRTSTKMAAPVTVMFNAAFSCKNNEDTIVSSLVRNAIRKFDKKHTWFDVFGSVTEQTDIPKHVMMEPNMMEPF